MSLPLPLLWLLEMLAPEFCVLCGRPRGAVAWWEPPEALHRICGRNDPHLCRECWDALTEREPARAMLEYAPGRRVPVRSAQHTNPALVRLVAALKYRHLRGLALPLTELLVRDAESTTAILIPVPLHGRRHRQRGFNQAAVLAAGLAARRGGVVREDILRRRRSTDQQARQEDAAARARNLGGAFQARPGPKEAATVFLVDDIVTSGATAAAALVALEGAGWNVAGVSCLGLAAAGAQEDPLGG